MIWKESAEGLQPAQLSGFFDGWAPRPPEERLLRALRGSSHVVLALESEDGPVLGFVTALADGELCAFLPLLEVRRDHRGRGLGTELVRRMLARLEGTYAIDLACDAPLVPFYERLGFQPATAMLRRDRSRLS